MSPFEPHRTSTVAASVVVAACVAAPVAGFSQAELELVANDEAQQKIFDAIATAASSGGARSAELVGPYTGLALQYLESNDYDLALAAVAEALHVVRVNSGVYSLEQVPLLRLAGRIEEAKGERAAAWRTEQEVLALTRRNSNDLAIVPILRDLADGRGGSLGVLYKQVAIGVLLRNGQDASEELRTLETELVHDSYLTVAFRSTRALVRGPAYEVGRDSLQRLAGYPNPSVDPLLARVEALVAMADWELLFKEKGSALEIYEHAYALLKENAEQSTIDTIFAPPVPVVLPTFLSNPLSAARPADSQGFVEVGFEIGKYGVATGVTVLESSTISNDDMEHRFVQWVRNSRFRPRVVGDGIAREPVVARNYLGTVPAPETEPQRRRARR
jgi:tetratricopeptide (TPR) repeat protein